MSMPTFPDCCLGITEKEAFNMMLGAIAMEELALSHIMNAEGEKLQYVLGTLPGKCGACASKQEVLEVNRSISNVLDRVSHNQLLLKETLQLLLESRECDTCSQPQDSCCAEPHGEPCCPQNPTFENRRRHFQWRCDSCPSIRSSTSNTCTQ